MTGLKKRIAKLEQKFYSESLQLIMPKWLSDQLPPDVRKFHESGNMAKYITPIEIYNAQWKDKNFFEFTRAKYEQYLKDQQAKR